MRVSDIVNSAIARKQPDSSYWAISDTGSGEQVPSTKEGLRNVKQRSPAWFGARQMDGAMSSSRLGEGFGYHKPAIKKAAAVQKDSWLKVRTLFKYLCTPFTCFIMVKSCKVGLRSLIPLTLTYMSKFVKVDNFNFQNSIVAKAGSTSNPGGGSGLDEDTLQEFEQGRLDLPKLKVSELKDICRAVKLPLRGKKVDLVNRLQVKKGHAHVTRTRVQPHMLLYLNMCTCCIHMHTQCRHLSLVRSFLMFSHTYNIHVLIQ